MGAGKPRSGSLGFYPRVRAAKHLANFETFQEIVGKGEKAHKIVLLVEMQPSLTAIGKKKADIFEMNIAGTLDEQFAFAKEKFGKDIKLSDVFAAQEFLDVRSVNKGKGFQGVVKRFGVKV